MTGLNGSTWQPMETAPKDGTHFLAWDKDSIWPDVLHWEDYDEETQKDEGVEGYYTYSEDLIADVVPADIENFVGWMPLPPAPEGAGQ